MGIFGGIIDWLFGSANDDVEYRKVYNIPQSFRPFPEGYTYGETPQEQEAIPRGPARHEGRGTTQIRTAHSATANAAPPKSYEGYRSEKVDQYMRDIDSVLRSCGEAGTVCNGSIDFRRGKMTMNLSSPVQNGGAVEKELKRAFGRNFDVRGSTIRVSGKWGNE